MSFLRLVKANTGFSRKFGVKRKNYPPDGGVGGEKSGKNALTID